MSLGPTEKEPHSNAGSWGRDPGAEQSERTGQDQKANQGVAAGVDGGGPGRPGRQGRHRVGCGSRGRARFIGALRKGPRKAHLLPFGALASIRPHGGEGGEPERGAERARMGDWRPGTLMRAAT